MEDKMPSPEPAHHLTFPGERSFNRSEAARADTAEICAMAAAEGAILPAMGSLVPGIHSLLTMKEHFQNKVQQLFSSSAASSLLF